MNALSGEQLLAWVEVTSTEWRALLTAHPEALAFPCDLRETESVAQALQHIVAVELRYAQRLADLPQSDYAVIPYGSVDEIYRTHDMAMTLYRELLARADFDWEQIVEFQTRSAGTLKSSRRTILVHALMHSIRHYAQLATLVRQHGVKPGWQMDYLFMGATGV